MPHAHFKKFVIYFYKKNRIFEKKKTLGYQGHFSEHFALGVLLIIKVF